MAYTAEISRSKPTCLILILDQSRSMADGFGEYAQSKGQFIADVVNRTLFDLVIRCTRTEEVRDYYYVSVIGYGKTVAPILDGTLADRALVPISKIAAHPRRIETRDKVINTGDRLVPQQTRFPVWVDTVCGGWTHTCAALDLARKLVDQWLSEHRDGFPPTILHLTDGGSTDGDPTGIGLDILSRSTSDGNVLLFNCHVSSRHHFKIEYPPDSSNLPDNRARILFGISSLLPDSFLRAASGSGISVRPGARGFVFNGDPASVVQFFELGTRAANT